VAWPSPGRGSAGAVRTDETPATVASDPDEAPTARERLAELIEDRLDIPMALLAVLWTALVAYELIAPADLRGALATAGNVIWGIFALELLAKLVVAGNPLVFLRRRWPSVLFLMLPALRMLRVLRAVRALRVLPAARVVGSSYRAIGTARSLLGGRLAFLSVVSAVVVFGSAQLLVLAEGGRDAGSLGDALWWSANLAISGNLVFEPSNAASRLISVVLAAYAVVVFASVAATLGAFFIESRAERAAAEDV
jgi:voltage-gated potassium channel